MAGIPFTPGHGVRRHATRPSGARPEIRRWIRPRPPPGRWAGRWHVGIFANPAIDGPGRNQCRETVGLDSDGLGEHGSHFDVPEVHGPFAANGISSGSSVASLVATGALFMVGF